MYYAHVACAKNKIYILHYNTYQYFWQIKMIILHCYFDVVMITRWVKTKLKDGAVLFFEKSRYYGYAKIRAG